ncbi:hypothetical protein [Alkalicoccus halolimnae]|uniref:Uncharacterized protein n=1 Tax=Alkalicoccus halolimnae TaxID=1667239 RepID=A0A5C7FCG1_9BACI|nr:hypothetical protein [Alkalicoccus halolimnae]TXF82309.1 hypothetical protein FTX54_14760 [Alkalicoccus halolimnae]
MMSLSPFLLFGLSFASASADSHDDGMNNNNADNNNNYINNNDNNAYNNYNNNNDNWNNYNENEGNELPAPSTAYLAAPFLGRLFDSAGAFMLMRKKAVV